ncbi:MAG: ribosome hibernation-promoting factor, HPF/YfiA family [Actinomycetota bacterium]
MAVIVKSRHTRVPEALKKLAVEKVERVRRISDRITKLEIEFSEEHNPRVRKRHRVEVILATKAHVLRAEATGVDQASAMNAVVDKLEIQVRRMKDKVVKRGRVGSKAQTIRIPSTTPTNGSKVQSRVDAKSHPRVRRTGRFSVEPMTPEQAVRALEATDELFLPFMNAETDLVSVVYRNGESSFGLVEPAE